MKSGQVSEILAHKCSSTSNVSSSREVSETTVEVSDTSTDCSKYVYEHKESNLYSYCSVGFGHSVIAFKY